MPHPSSGRSVAACVCLTLCLMAPAIRPASGQTAAGQAAAGQAAAGQTAPDTSRQAVPLLPLHYDTMASAPDPLSFVRHGPMGLTLQDNPLRFGGVNITWLGMRRDGGAPARRPALAEIQDALATARALGAAVIRLPGLVSTAGCALCLESAPGQISADALAELDLVLSKAADMGLKVILPLADSGASCAADKPATGVSCAGGDAAGFFTDGARKAAFLLRVQAIVSHVNARTGVAYAEDPTILAWEDCDACAGAADPATVATWVEAVGRTVKAADKRHLFEDGAFAGRIAATAAHQVPPAEYAQTSVDLVGDRPAVNGDVETMRRTLAETAEAVAQAGRVYVLDDFPWAPPVFPTQASLEDWLTSVLRARAIGGALTGDLQSHAATGGYLPPPDDAAPGVAALYFPGHKTPAMDILPMQERGRALRRFFYTMTGAPRPPPYLLTPPPQILSTTGGLVRWRGAAGAASYSVERSSDPAQPYSWTTPCDACTSDEIGQWQDPDKPDGKLWYRVMPLNINGHRAVPSAPEVRK